MKKNPLLKFQSTLLLIAFTFGLKAQTAELQVIHNAADPAAQQVDVYVNGTLALDNFAFREATPFLTLPAGSLLNIGVAPGNSTSVNDTLKNFPVVLVSGQRYVAIANGVLNPASFAANPDGRPTGFTLFIKDNISLTAAGGNVDFIVEHGATDAPAVDVIARNVATLVSNAAYGDITNYISVPPSGYVLDVTPAGNNSVIVASYAADLSALAGGTAVVVASGFLNPAANQNGPAFALFAFLADGSGLQLPQVSLARLQVIHNAADPAAESVDIYVDGALLIDDFTFRAATPFIDVPGDVIINVGVAPGNSTSASDTLKNFEVSFDNGKTYVAIAQGVLNPGSFAPNPDGNSTAFTILLQDGIRESAANASDVDLRVVHGATDAPTVDVIARSVATLVDNASYQDITGYVSVPPSDYLLDITPGNDNSVIVATFAADLTSLTGGAAVVLASGFLNPAANQNGEAFTLIAVLPDGTVITLPTTEQARLQVIHNAADPAAASVDVYVNGALLLDNFAFRTATPFVDVPAGVTLSVGVAPGNSTTVNDTIANFDIALQNGKTYVAIAQGVLNPGSFASNPDGISTAFTLLLQDGIRESALNATDVDLRVVHGATDAPTVDVLTGGNVIVDNAAYKDITGYLSVPGANYVLDITPGNNNSVIVASFSAPLNLITGQSAVVLATGFLNPAANQNGEAFRLMAVLADGTVILLPVVTGIDEEVNPLTVSVFPNPVTDFITVQTGNSANGVIYITDVAGRVLTEQNFNGTNNQVDVRLLNKGVYFLNVNSEEKISTSRFIKN